MHLSLEATTTARSTKPRARAIDRGFRPVADLGRLGIDDLQLLAAMRAVDEQTSISTPWQLPLLIHNLGNRDLSSCRRTGCYCCCSQHCTPWFPGASRWLSGRFLRSNFSLWLVLLLWGLTASTRISGIPKNKVKRIFYYSINLCHRQVPWLFY